MVAERGCSSSNSTPKRRKSRSKSKKNLQRNLFDVNSGDDETPEKPSPITNREADSIEKSVPTVSKLPRIPKLKPAEFVEKHSSSDDDVISLVGEESFAGKNLCVTVANENCASSEKAENRNREEIKIIIENDAVEKSSFASNQINCERRIQSKITVPQNKNRFQHSSQPSQNHANNRNNFRRQNCNTNKFYTRDRPYNRNNFAGQQTHRNQFGDVQRHDVNSGQPTNKACNCCTHNTVNSNITLDVNELVNQVAYSATHKQPNTKRKRNRKSSGVRKRAKRAEENKKLRAQGQLWIQQEQIRIQRERAEAQANEVYGDLVF